MHKIRLLLQQYIQAFWQDLNVSAALQASKTDPVYRKVELQRTGENFYKLLPASLLTVLSLFCGLLYHLRYGEALHRTRIYIGVFLVMLIGTVFLLCYMEYLLRKTVVSPKAQQLPVALYWGAAAAAFSVCSYLEAIETGTILQYLIFVLLLSLNPVFHPQFCVPYFLYAGIAEIFALSKAQAPFVSLLFISGITVFCVMSAFLRYSHYMAKQLALERLALLAEHDALTSVLNRRGMQKRADILLDSTARSGQTLTVAVIDIDYFKSYNDAFGHAQGDRCLQQIAACIQKTFSRRTDLVCRYGGEEFLLLFVGDSPTQASENLLRLQTNIAALQLKSGNPNFLPFVSVSIGAVHTHPKFDDGLEPYIKQADTYLYRAKQTGRNCICLNDSLFHPAV